MSAVTKVFICSLLALWIALAIALPLVNVFGMDAWHPAWGWLGGTVLGIGSYMCVWPLCYAFIEWVTGCWNGWE